MLAIHFELKINFSYVKKKKERNRECYSVKTKICLKNSERKKKKRYGLKSLLKITRYIFNEINIQI